MKVLAIDKGLGYEKKKFLIETYENCEILVVPEPTDDFKKGKDLLNKKLEEYQPDILILGSRGGKFLNKDLQNKSKAGVLLISAMCNYIHPKTATLWLHGKKDLTIPLQQVRGVMNYADKKITKLVEIEDDHSMKSVIQNKTLDNYIKEVLRMRTIANSNEFKEDNTKPKQGFSLANLLSEIRKGKK